MYHRVKFILKVLREMNAAEVARKISRDRVQIPYLLNIKSKKCWHEPNMMT